MSLIPEKKDSYPVPPFEDLTMLIFGCPGAGKTWFCASAEKTLFIATEPGHEFTKAPDIAINDWGTFKALVKEIADLKKSDNPDQMPYTSFVVDIVDNLQMHCRDWVCKQKGLAYPPTNDFGKTWAEINAEWRGWIGALMRLGKVRFISHCNFVEHEVTLENGMKEQISRAVPTFSGNKAAQFLDGILNAMGYITQNHDGKRMITFRQTPSIAAKDRTNILSELGEMPSDWSYVANAYEQKAKELGLEVLPSKT